MKLVALSAILVTVLATSGWALTPCHHRDYGHGTTVCVCNTAHCDQLPSIARTAQGVVTSYVTSKDGDRLKRTGTAELLPGAPPPSGHGSRQDGRTSTIHLNRNVHHQQVIGWGGAFTDAAGLNIATLPVKLQARLMRDYYGEDGLQYSMGRVPIGGTDFSTRPYTYDDQPEDESLATFALQHEDYDYKLPYIRMANTISATPIKLLSTPWSPPAWMKTNNELHRDGFLKGQPGGKYYKLFAQYVIKFLQAYARENVTFWGMTVENEPEYGFDPDWVINSLGMNGSMERDYVKLDLGPALEQAGFGLDKLKLMIHDDNLPVMESFVDTVLSDERAAQYVAGVAFHWYNNDDYPNREPLHHVHNKFPDKFLLASEGCEVLEGKPLELGVWDVVNKYALDIIRDLNAFTTGWIDWNLALDLRGGPNWIEGYTNAAIIVNATSGEYYKQPFFYVLGHFSKFLPENSVRIEQVGRLRDGVLATSFVRPDSGTVVVIVNTNDHDEQVAVVDGNTHHLVVQVKKNSVQNLIWY